MVRENKQWKLEGNKWVRGIREQQKTKGEWAQLAEGRTEGEVGSGRNGRLLSPTASRDKLSGAIFLFFYFRARVNARRDFTDLQEISAGFSSTSPKSVCMYVCLRRFVQESVQKKVATPSETWQTPPPFHFVWFCLPFVFKGLLLNLVIQGGSN